MVKSIVEAIAALAQSLPRILDLFDDAVGAFKRWQDKRAEKKLEKRQEEKRDAKAELGQAETDKQRRKALRKLKRLG